MAMEIEFKVDARKFKKSFEDVESKYRGAFKQALNMAASMMRTEMAADIAKAGNYNTDALTVTVEERSRIGIRVDLPGANILETGGTIQGNPLLWLPLSGTDAVGTQASTYPGGVFSIKRKSGVPLLFSVADHEPKFFGISSVKVAKKFHIGDIRQSVMDRFAQILNNSVETGGNNGGA